MARPQSTTGNACRAVLWLLPLVAFLALPAHASTPRSSTDALELDSTPHVSIALDVAALELTDDAPSFELGEASLLAELRQEHFHLDGAELLSEEPRRAPPLSYPETRVRGFDFLGQEVIGLFEGVTLELRWGCERFGLGISEGNGVNLYAFVGQRPHEKTDPLGLAAVDPELPKILGLIDSAAEEAARQHGLKSIAEVRKGGKLGTQVHATMEKLLSKGGKYFHPRIATELEVNAAGEVVRSGKRGFAGAGSLVKDVVVLKPGLTVSTIPKAAAARDVAQYVLDLKTGLGGADPRYVESLSRYGSEVITFKPHEGSLRQFAEIATHAPDEAGVLRSLRSAAAGGKKPIVTAATTAEELSAGAKVMSGGLKTLGWIGVGISIWQFPQKARAEGVVHAGMETAYDLSLWSIPPKLITGYVEGVMSVPGNRIPMPACPPGSAYDCDVPIYAP